MSEVINCGPICVRRTAATAAWSPSVQKFSQETLSDFDYAIFESSEPRIFLPWGEAKNNALYFIIIPLTVVLSKRDLPENKN